MRLSLAAAVLACASAAHAEGPIESLDPPRQFDFWIGDWDVTARFWDAAKGQATVPGAQLHVEPVLDGQAILEHYRGTNWLGADILGFSLRAYDPEKEAWVILLNWPSTDAPFWTMEGGFDFNRGVFQNERPGPDNTTLLTRYTFSDLLPGFYRWEVNTSTDDGVTWTFPGYTMHGTRRPADAEPIDEAWLHGDDIEDRCTGDQRDQLDFMTGQWTAETSFRAAGGRWATHQATLTSRPILAGCAHLNAYTQPGDTPHESLTTLAYDAKRGAWVAYAMSTTTHGAMQRYEGIMRNGELALLRNRPDTTLERLRWHDIADDSYQWDHAISEDNGETWITDATATFTRNK